MNKVIMYKAACQAYLAYLDQPDGDWWQDFPDAGVEANVYEGNLVFDNDETVYITLYPYDPDRHHTDKPLAHYYFDGSAVVEDDRE